MDEADLYKYRAQYVRNYDGDTVTFNIDLGLNTWVMEENVRLLGVDTPEIRGGTSKTKAKAKEARNFVSKRLASAVDILIETELDDRGRYGRLLATVWYVPVDHTDGSFRNLNRELIEEGLAEKY